MPKNHVRFADGKEPERPHSPGLHRIPPRGILKNFDRESTRAYQGTEPSIRDRDFNRHAKDLHHHHHHRHHHHHHQERRRQQEEKDMLHILREREKIKREEFNILKEQRRRRNEEILREREREAQREHERELKLLRQEFDDRLHREHRRHRRQHPISTEYGSPDYLDAWKEVDRRRREHRQRVGDDLFDVDLSGGYLAVQQVRILRLGNGI